MASISGSLLLAVQRNGHKHVMMTSAKPDNELSCDL